MDRLDTPVTFARLSTGIESLDALMDGGLPAQSVTVLTGPPGTGKTVLAMQMVFAQARLGKRCLYLTTLSEPALKLVRYMRLFEFFDEGMVDDRVVFADLGGALIEGGAEQAVALIREKLETSEPDVVVIDSFKAIHDVAGADIATSRSMAYQLSVMLAAWGSTTLLLGEYPAGELTEYPEFAIADGIIAVSNEARGLSRVREIEVLKLRGANYVPGRHFFDIRTRGVAFYPRVRGPVADTDAPWANTREATGLPGLDAMLMGGLPTGSTTLVQGGTGTGKSLLSLRFLTEGARRGQPGVLFGLEERPTQIRAIANGFGWQLEDLEARGLLRLHHTSPVELNADQFLGDALAVIEETGARRVVFDSASALEMGLDNSGRFRELTYAVSAHLRSLGVTTILTAEIPELLGTTQLSGHSISPIADNIVLLRYVELSGELGRAISVLKMRGSSHGRQLRQFSFNGEGPLVGDPFSKLHGVLTGIPEPAGS